MSSNVIFSTSARGMDARNTCRMRWRGLPLVLFMPHAVLCVGWRLHLFLLGMSLFMAIVYIYSQSWGDVLGLVDNPVGEGVGF